MHEIAYDERRSGWVGYVWCTTTDEGTQQYYWSLSYSGELGKEGAKDEVFGPECTVIPDSEFYDTLEEAQRSLAHEMDKHAPADAAKEVTIGWISA
jgi:hypothetical protein